MNDYSADLLEWREFLTNHPVGTRGLVQGAASEDPRDIYLVEASVPDLRLRCDGECQCLSYCKGKTTKKSEKVLVGIGENSPRLNRTPCDVVLWYSCEKCGRQVKSYIVRFWSLEDVQKIAEWPPFAPPTPSKVIRLIRPDRDLFLKGRQAEIAGLGVGAFAYYRRIIENQKNQLLEEIIRVARHVGANEDVIDELQAAKKQTQFSKAVENIKCAIPEVLLIRGHNPLTLLHSALSEGLHDATDEACLVAAGDVRRILIELAERLTEAMADHKKLNDALSRLVRRKK